MARADTARDRARLAAEALAQAKADARARGDVASGSRRMVPGEKPVETERTGGSGHGHADSHRGRSRIDDPRPLTSVLDDLLDARGWQQRAAVGSVFGRWAEIVGTDLAAHTRPDSFADGELAVLADSTAWATQVRLLASVLVGRLNAELGDDCVRRVKVRGPMPPRRRGAWRVPGSTGPRDTYG